MKPYIKVPVIDDKGNEIETVLFTSHIEAIQSKGRFTSIYINSTTENPFDVELSLSEVMKLIG